MATSLPQFLRSGKRLSFLPAKIKDYGKLLKIPNSSFHSSIPRIPLALPWHHKDIDDETAHESEGGEVEWGNIETFGGADLHSLGEYMLPKHLDSLDKVEKVSQLRFHHFEEVRRSLFLLSKSLVVFR